MKNLRSFLFVALSVISAGGIYYVLNHLQAPNCEQVRAGLDVGSGSTKLLVGKVDVCRKKVISILLDKSEKIDFQENLSKSSDNMIAEEFAQQGAKTISGFVAEAKALGAPAVKGFATAAFRKASNGTDVIAEIAQTSGASIEVISQQAEGEIGLEGVNAILDIPPQNLVVWDIGGGSQEITALTQGRQIVHKGMVASVGFKDMVIKQIQRKDPAKTNSPNPVSAEQAQEAIKASKSIAHQIPEEIRKALANPGVQVVGIGGVHWYSVRSQTGEKEVYTQSDVAEALMNQTGRTDTQINSKFASTEVTNLALVLGHMQELAIASVRPLRVNMAVAAMFR